ncbi:conserved hypothetical protein [Rhodopseudomonas palustris HaA2]|uniref:Uncharacterized protein n=1 Tax=Rhodopseudomonas palustris (strain HaA2) TaxID=316058 RepID=Q2IYV0_RHOP2|nr:hypothetical protein [Rhodopseudomonas palustris]ABD06610.1 conserved hypothetical protein [Rhodopseudomonas palustris HaA2]
MTRRTMTMAMLMTLGCGGVAAAQDVPGIEICTAEKTMERRTSCLQSNVEFLHRSLDKTRRDQQQRLDAANRQIEALKSALAEMQTTLTALRAAPKQPEPAAAAAKDSAPAKNAAPKPDAK